MNPYRRCTFYIIHRTDFYAFPAFDTHIRIYSKLAVCDHLLIKVTTDHIGVEAGSGSFLQLLNTLTTCFDDIDDMNDLLFSLCNLSLLFLF